ncbi:hypothetical protein D3C86_360460 [compost metagenome]
MARVATTARWKRRAPATHRVSTAQQPSATPTQPSAEVSVVSMPRSMIRRLSKPGWPVSMAMPAPSRPTASRATKPPSSHWTPRLRSSPGSSGANARQNMGSDGRM